MAIHPTTQDDQLRQALLAGDAHDDIDLVPRVIASARRRLAARNVLVFVFGRLWLALIGLLAPLVARIHRSRHP